MWRRLAKWDSRRRYAEEEEGLHRSRLSELGRRNRQRGGYNRSAAVEYVIVFVCFNAIKMFECFQRRTEV